MRLVAFVLALLLLAGSIDPTRGWLIALVVVTGLAWVRPRPWNLFEVRPVVDVRLASFVLAVLLLAGTVEATRDWLIALSIVTGVAAFMPRVFGLPMGRHRRHGFWSGWDWDWCWGWDDDEDDDERRAGRPWRHWERRARRRAERFEDDWP